MNKLPITKHHYDFILYKAWADLRAEARRYYLSYIWWILGPVLEMLVFYVVFGVLLKRGTENFVPFLLIGVITWNWFGATTQHCAVSIFNSRSLIQQVDLPKIIFPLIVVCTDSFKFLIAFSIVLIFVNAYGMTMTSTYLALPLLMFTQLMVINALGIMFAAITPFFPDFQLLISYVLRMLFFMSGIFYDVRNIPEHYHSLFLMNPMARLIHEYRNVLMHSQWPNWTGLAVITMLSALAILIISKVIHRYDKIYPRILAQ